MNDSNRKNINSLEVATWLIIIMITAAAFFVTYYFDYSTPIYIAIWIIWLALTFVLGFYTKKGKQVFEFAKESNIELQKVSWPTRQETIQTTSIVMIMVTLTGFIL